MIIEYGTCERCGLLMPIIDQKICYSCTNELYAEEYEDNERIITHDMARDACDSSLQNVDY